MNRDAALFLNVTTENHIKRYFKIINPGLLSRKANDHILLTHHTQFSVPKFSLHQRNVCGQRVPNKPAVEVCLLFLINNHGYSCSIHFI